jgi:hypothetical protein
MSNNSQRILIKKPDKIFEVSNLFDKCEIVIETFGDNIQLSDIVHGYDNFILQNLKPIKRIKIGNGGSFYKDLKSIIILDNADFIVTDKDGYVLDYFTNSDPLSPVSINEKIN